LLGRSKGAEATSAMSQPSKPLRIYVVEDSPLIRRSLASVIAEAGGELVGVSADAEGAIRNLVVHHPDVILIDIRLESGNGFDVLRALQQYNLAPGARKVVITNYAHAEYKELAVRLGADEFFDKTHEMSQAVELINTMVKQKRRGTAMAQH
jgi:DNA-binding NarL/FixJ family response regulator